MKKTLALLLAAVIMSAGTTSAQIEPPPRGLVSYWNFDDNTADGAWLYRGQSDAAEDNLKVAGGPARYVPGKVGRAILLDRAYLSTRFSPDVKLGSSYTIEAWVKPTSLHAVGWHRLLLHWGSQRGYHFAIHDKQVSLYHKQTDGEEMHPEGGTVAEGKWQHVAAVADAENRRLTVYLDGEPVAQTPYDGTIAETTREGLGVGDSAGGPSETSRYVGALDELAVWNVPLSDEQVQAHFRNPGQRFGLAAKTFRQVMLDSKPQGYWQLDEPRGTAIEDASGNGHHGTGRGVKLGRCGIPSVPGNKAATFDGKGACIELGDVEQFQDLPAVSVEAWVRMVEPADGFSGVTAFLRKEGVFAFGAGWVGENSASQREHKARFWIHAGQQWLHSGNGSTELNDGRWHHVAGVYDGQFVRIYVDGIEESSHKIGPLTLSSNTDPLFMGAAGGSGEFFPGRIDEAAFYTRALSATEVYEHYVFGEL